MIGKTFLATIAISFLLGSIAAIPAQLTKADDKTLKLPVTIGQPIYTTPAVSGVTERYIIITKGFDKTYLDIDTGNIVKNPVKTNDFDWSTGTTTQVDENKYVSIDYHSYSEHEKYLTFEDTVIVSREKGIAANCSEIDRNNSLLTIWDIDKQKVLWDFKLQMSPSDIDFGKLLVVDEYLIFSDQGQTMFFDLMTGKLRLVTRPVSVFLPQRWEKYLILDSQVIDLEQMKSVFDFTGYSFRLDKTGRLYLYPVSSTADSKWTYYFDLHTLELKTYEYKKPEDGRFDSSYTQGVCNGLFMRWNAGLMASEIVDPVTGKVYFSHPEVTTHIGWRGFTDNGRQIVFFDAAEIYCFDSVTKQVLWSKELIITTRELGRNYWWSPTKDPTKIRVFDITNQKKSVMISFLPNEWRWIPSVYPYDEFLLVVDSVSANDKSIFQRIGWDGTVTDMPELPDTNINLRLPFVYKNQIFAWVVAENNGILYKLEKNAWMKVMESPVSESWSCDVSDKYFVFIADANKLTFFNLETNTSQSVDGSNVFDMSFKGSLLVAERNAVLVIDPASCKILDSGSGTFIGFDDDAVYFFKDNMIRTISKNNITQTPLKGTDDFDKYHFSAANGFVKYDSALYGPDGSIAQLDGLFYLYKLKSINDQPCLCNDDHTRATFFKIKEALTYSLKMSSAGIVVTNLGKTNLTGKFWLEPFEGLVCKKLGDAKTIDIAPGKSATIDIGQLKDFLLVSETNGLLSARDSDKSFNPLHSSNYVGNFDSQTQSYTDIRRIVVK
jgi:hypothetical protein